jgi:putative ABC transport system substrate-binding protein
MNNRRKLVIALASSAPHRSARRAVLLAAAAWLALAWTGAVRAQSKQPILIGWLNTASRESSGHYLTAFKEGFAALGWKDGSDFRLEERWADGRVERLQSLADELAAKEPALIVAAPVPAVAAAAKAAPKTPIVLANGNPLATGLVISLARPGGMITGLSNVNTETDEKLLELLLAAAPELRRIGFLADPTLPSYDVAVRGARRSMEHHRVDARFAEAARPEDIEPAISRLAQEGAQALILLSSSWFVTERQRLVSLARLHSWPLIANQREFAEEGALLSYGVDRTALYRRAAYYVDRILKGTKPGDLPIEQPTKFELVINMKTAKARGLTVPQSLLLRADEVIQ